MEGEKEKQWEQQEEKESNEAEDDDGDSERALMVWQEGREKDELGNPIMHWEALSLCIAELEKQQEEEKRAKAGAALEQGSSPLGWTEDRLDRLDRSRAAGSWEDGNDACNSHVLALTSRLHTQTNLQLCFINNSESEEEEEEEEEEGEDVGKEMCNKKSSSSWQRSAQSHRNTQNPGSAEQPKSRGFRSTLRNLRDRLRIDQRRKTAPHREPAAERSHLQRGDAERLSVDQMEALCASLRRDIQDLSSELVSCLHVRDQLRTEQDAMLLEVQDLTSL